MRIDALHPFYLCLGAMDFEHLRKKIVASPEQVLDLLGCPFALLPASGRELQGVSREAEYTFLHLLHLCAVPLYSLFFRERVKSIDDLEPFHVLLI